MLMDGVSNKENKEYTILQATVENAKKYKTELERLLNLNFNTPNPDLTRFAKENGLSLNDPNVQSCFILIRDDYLKKVNEFYKKNLSLDSVFKKDRPTKSAKRIKKILDESKKDAKPSNRQINPQYLVFLSWIIIIILITYLSLSIN
jgi:hypothetical protein